MGMAEEYKSALQALNAMKGPDGRLRVRNRVERDIVVLWCSYRGRSARTTAEMLGVSTASVARRRASFVRNPSAIFNYPVMRQGPSVYPCEFCGTGTPVKGTAGSNGPRPTWPSTSSAGRQST